MTVLLVVLAVWLAVVLLILAVCASGRGTPPSRGGVPRRPRDRPDRADNRKGFPL